MAIKPEDLQPKEYIVKVGENEYVGKPPKLSHQLIIQKIKPLFTALEAIANGEEIDLDTQKIISFQDDLDILFAQLVPDLQNVTLDAYDIVDVLDQIVTAGTPTEAQELKNAKVKAGGEQEGKVGKTA